MKAVCCRGGATDEPVGCVLARTAPNQTAHRRASCQRHAVNMPTRAGAIRPSTPLMYPDHIRRRSKRSTGPTKSPPLRTSLTRRALPTRAGANRPSTPSMYPGHIRRRSKRSTGPTKSPPLRSPLTRRVSPTRAVAIQPSNPSIYPGHVRRSSKRSTGPTKSPPRGGASAMRGGLRPLFRARVVGVQRTFAERSTMCESTSAIFRRQKRGAKLQNRMD